MTRLTDGRWAPGRSGNPGGRPGGVAEVRELARSHTAEAIERLVKEMNNGDTSNARIAAANALLDRGWGKPTQPLAGAPDEPPIGIEMSIEEQQAEARRAIEEAFAEPVRDEPIAESLPMPPPNGEGTERYANRRAARTAGLAGEPAQGTILLTGAQRSPPGGGLQGFAR
jgi:hypothetical protein